MAEYDRGARQAWPDLGRSLGKTAEGGSVKEWGGEVGCCAWHPSLLCLLLPLPQDFSFSPQSWQLATQFTLLFISLVLPRP